MLNKNFLPAYVWVKSFLAGATEPFTIAIENEKGISEVYNTKINKNDIEKSKFYIERTVKTLLWIYGGFKIYLCGNDEICGYIKKTYSYGGTRSFDADFMSEIYERPFEVCICQFPPDKSCNINKISINSYGKRIGLDIGGSFIKVCAMDSGNMVYGGRIAWSPSDKTDISYHTSKLREAIKKASGYLSCVDRIGISSAGIHIGNTTRIASVFRSVNDKKSIRNLYKSIANGIPVTVVNDGDTAAMCGMINGGCKGILGISIGTSEAGGYVDMNGNISGGLNELAFVPVDFSEGASADEWSGDIGCGAVYLSQKSVIELAPFAGIVLDSNKSPSENCYQIQTLARKNAEPAVEVYRTIGEYLGYAIAYYSLFYEFEYVMLAGGVVAGSEGGIVKKSAIKILEKIQNKRYNFIDINNGDSSYLNQAIAASYLKTN